MPRPFADPNRIAPNHIAPNYIATVLSAEYRRLVWWRNVFAFLIRTGRPRARRPRIGAERVDPRPRRHQGPARRAACHPAGHAARAGRDAWRPSGPARPRWARPKGTFRAGTAQLPVAGGAREPVRTLGHRQRPRQRRCRLPADAELPGLRRHLARADARRMRGGPDQHQPGLGRAAAQHPGRRIPPPDRRARPPPRRHGPGRSAAAGDAGGGAGGCRAGFRDRTTRHGTARLRPTPVARAAGPRAADLHLRHHRPAEGRQRLARPHRGMEPAGSPA